MKIYAMSDIHGCYDAFLDALKNGYIPILMVDTKTNKYYEITVSGK